MNRTPNRSSWLVVAALVVAAALSAVGLYAWRERGAWLRVPPGKVHVCIQIEGSSVSGEDLGGLEIRISLFGMSRMGAFGSPRRPEWERVASQVSTVFRPAYLQYALASGEMAGGRGFRKDELLAFRDRLPESTGSTTIFRLALVDEQGELIHLDPWPPAPGF